MNKGTYSFALLQYHHSQILGEVLNIGLLVYFPELKRLEFIYPEKLIRLRFAYPNVPEKTIKSYFRLFSKRVAELNTNKEVFADSNLDNSLEKFIQSEFLPPDSSSIQFGNFRKGVLYTHDTKHITDQLYNLYFSVFQHQENIARRIDEAHLLNHYKQLLRQITHSDFSALKEEQKLSVDYHIEPSSGNILKFEIAWKAKDDLHLVKPISFDLAKPESIVNKAYRYYGQYLTLEQYADENDICFDVILAKPKRRELFKSYDFAIDLLEKPNRVQLIDEAELNRYSQETVSAFYSDLDVDF